MATDFLAAADLAAAGALGPAAAVRSSFATTASGDAAIGSHTTIGGYTTVAEAGKQEVGSFCFGVARSNDQAGYQQHGKQRVQFHIVHSLLDQANF
ncbi:MAG: hypothetical protein GTO53_07210 [Planctomycetales bacterium]|nr:hypothetical protein [Planctomycetales bacterium]NIM08925.1 hypothetical protein [Planctomycetales bacterium]NIN08395.1 hypothetical protein [Planctomycetales bacterium]NIN77523.1 hypothetical protein [Planctomycetales bacterium]NIO46494.1 hypothetical protein [Planctomycetales bacterium]